MPRSTGPTHRGYLSSLLDISDYHTAAPLVTDEVPPVLSQLILTRKDTSEPSLWFIPHDLPLPLRLQLGPSHSKRRTEPHIPRPRNPFILFRSHFLGQRVLPDHVAFCRDHRQVSRIVSHVWRVLPEHEKQRFYILSQEERRLHQLRYPGYASPSIASNNLRFKPASQNLAATHAKIGSDEFKCEQIAELLIQDVQGDKLFARIMEIVEAVTSNHVPLPPTNLSEDKKVIKAEEMDLDANLNYAFARKVSKMGIKKSRLESKSRAIKDESLEIKVEFDSFFVPRMNPRRGPVVSYAEEDSEDTDFHEAKPRVLPKPSPTITFEGLSPGTPEALVEASSSPSTGTVVSGDSDKFPHWCLDAPAEQFAFDQGNCYEPYEDIYDSTLKDSTYYTTAMQHPVSSDDRQVVHGGAPPGDAKVTDYDLYIDESSRLLYEEDA